MQAFERITSGFDASSRRGATITALSGKKPSVPWLRDKRFSGKEKR
jgi:hypothetical protein